MAIKSREVLVLGWSFVIFIFLLFGLASNEWESESTVAGTRKIGLWKECIGTQCKDRDADKMSSLEAAQGFATLCFLSALACILMQVVMYWFNFRQHVIRVAVMPIFSGVCGLICVSVYAGDVKKGSTSWSWGLPIFIVGWIFELTVGPLIYYVSRKPNVEFTATNEAGTSTTSV